MNQLCGSGLRAVALGMQQIASGDAKIVAAGGMESMSKAPHVAHLRDGVKMGDYAMVDTMIKDGLWDAFHGYHMGTTAENVARQWQITRDMQDEFAVKSQNKAEAAQAAGKFKDEIAPVTISTRKGDVMVDQDEYIKKGVTLESVGKLKPAFAKDGSVTAANASGINDGAAVVILMSEAEAAKRGLTPMARIASWASVGVDPAIMGSGPIPASRAALLKAGWKAEDLDLVEAETLPQPGDGEPGHRDPLGDLHAGRPDPGEVRLAPLGHLHDAADVVRERLLRLDLQLFLLGRLPVDHDGDLVHAGGHEGRALVLTEQVDHVGPAALRDVPQVHVDVGLVVRGRGGLCAAVGGLPLPRGAGVRGVLRPVVARQNSSATVFPHLTSLIGVINQIINCISHRKWIERIHTQATVRFFDDRLP